MNTAQAKALPLPEFLGQLGYTPARVRGDDVWYRSPFRPDERTPSFKIDRQKNVWFDHGVGEGGTIIDFVGALHATEDVSRILSLIADASGQAIPTELILPTRTGKEKPLPTIKSVGEIADRTLETYIASRGIPLDLARLYVKEIAYRVGEHDFRALGFANDAGGFEVRNPTFKGTVGKKDMTTFQKEGSRSAGVFEGFFDFLSVLAHYKKDRATGNVLVLNSLSFTGRGIERMQGMGIDQVHTYLDHDNAGQNAMGRLMEVDTWQVKDEAILYAGYKDANEYLV